jgi:hypothetical protein
VVRLTAATYTIDVAKFASANRQAIVAELLPNTPYGAMLRLAAITSIVPSDAAGAVVYTTRNVSTAELPLDGIVHDGRYVILTADAPVAYAWGQVHTGDATAPSVVNARVTAGVGKPLTSALGVNDITRAGGVFVIPVAATPAAQFALLAHINAIGDGDALLGVSVPAADTFVAFGILPLVAPPLSAPVIAPADGSVLNVDAPFAPQAVRHHDRFRVGGERHHHHQPHHRPRHDRYHQRRRFRRLFQHQRKTRRRLRVSPHGRRHDPLHQRPRLRSRCRLALLHVRHRTVEHHHPS